MKRTLNSYMENPMGIGSAAITSRQLIYRDYEARLAKIKDKVSMTPIILHEKVKDCYYFHITVPSETNRDNTYDVIIKFSTRDKELKASTSIANYDVQFFSNSPAFVYTYAYVYNMNQLLIPELKAKYDTTVLAKPPTKRNPQETFNYEKSIFFAAYTILADPKYMNKEVIAGISENYTIKKLENRIRNDEKVKQQIKREQRRISKKADDTVKDMARKETIMKRKVRNDFKGIGTGNVKKLSATKPSSSGIKKLKGSQQGIKRTKKISSVQNTKR